MTPRELAAMLIYSEGAEPEYLSIVEMAEDRNLDPEEVERWVRSAKVTVSWE